MGDLEERPAWSEKFQSVCSVPRFVSIIRELSDEQRDAVCSMGFGGLLSLSLKTLRADLLRWLVPQFHPIHQQFVIHGQLVDITPRDANLILGLAIGGELVEPIGRPRNVANVSRDLGLIGEREVYVKVFEEIVKSREANDRWRQAFVLYALGTFLCPTAHGRTRAYYLQHVAEVDTCRGFAWGPHVVEVCKRTLTAHQTTGKKIMGCCMPLLQLWYFEHTRLNPQIEWEPRPRLPLLKKWGDQQCRDRDTVLGFGAVHVIADIYPAVGDLDIIHDWREAGNEAPNVEPHALEVGDGAAEGVQEGADDELPLNLELGTTLVGEELGHVQDEPEVEEAPQTSHAAAGLDDAERESYQRQIAALKEELEVRSAERESHQRQIATLKGELEECKEMLRQSIYQNEMQKAQMEALSVVVGRMRNTAESEAGCTSSVAVNEPEVREIDAMEEHKEHEPECTEVQTLPSRDPLRRSSRPIKESRLLKSPYETLAKRRKGIVVTRFKRPKVTEDEIRSHPELLWNHKSTGMSLRQLTDADHQLVSYAFLSNGDASEQLFRSGDVVLTRKDLHTLALGQELSTTVMDAIILLAHVDQMSEREGIQRWYFDSIFMAYLTRDRFVPQRLYMPDMIKYHLGDAGWILFPICKDFHWCSLAVDSVAQKVYYLDSLRGGAKERMDQMVPRVASVLERIYSDIGEPKDVTRWEHVMAAGLPHQRNGVDCGIYTINNMRSFTGEGSVTYTPADIGMWRRHYAAYIIGHPENELQKEVRWRAAMAEGKKT